MDYRESQDVSVMLLGLLSALPVRYVDYHVLVHTLFKEKRVCVCMDCLRCTSKLHARAVQFEGGHQTSAWAAHFALPVSNAPNIAGHVPCIHSPAQASLGAGVLVHGVEDERWIVRGAAARAIAAYVC